MGALDWALNEAASIARAVAVVDEPIAGYVKLRLRAGIVDANRTIADITQAVIEMLAERRVIAHPSCVRRPRCLLGPYRRTRARGYPSMGSHAVDAPVKRSHPATCF
jgi:hypothetical protein